MHNITIEFHIPVFISLELFIQQNTIVLSIFVNISILLYYVICDNYDIIEGKNQAKVIIKKYHMFNKLAF